MSQVHSVTHVPVHSPLREVWFPYARAERTPICREGVAGGNVPLQAGGGRRVSGWRQGEAKLFPVKKSVVSEESFACRKIYASYFSALRGPWPRSAKS